MQPRLTLILLATLSPAATPFWSPLTPPRAHYSADLTYDPAASRFAGTETIRFRNTTDRPIGRIALQWIGELNSVSINGTPLRRVPAVRQVALFDLPSDDNNVTLSITFAVAGKLDPKTQSFLLNSAIPRLWWGSWSLDDYEVRLSAPDGYVWGASGRYDPARRAYIATGIRRFGAFLGKAYETAEAEAGDVRVRAVFTPQGRPCAELLLKTAVDVIGFYRNKFGVYPQRSLTIIPGMDYPAGGYPAATALVMIHGQHRMSERPEAFWRWITAHEIGHMYWGDYVLAQGPDSLNWLMIGLGIRADQEYRRARGITDAGSLEAGFVTGVTQGRDTTMDVTREQGSAIDWDFNNIVEHGKSIAMMNALESVIGRNAFTAMYHHIIHEYAGKRLGWREFQQLAEFQSGEDLDWFFEQWVRSPAVPFYRITAKDCAAAPDGFDCTVRVERDGAARMPVTVAVEFQDGSEQRAQTERLADFDELHFHSKAQMAQVALEPDHAMVMAEEPPTVRTVKAKIDNLPERGAGEAALRLYKQTAQVKIEGAVTRLKLLLALYDGRYYQEALELARSLDSGPPNDLRFAAEAWEGHLLDLLGRREEAIAAYQKALDTPGNPAIRHDQFGLEINRKWVEERLKTPFERR